MALTGKARSAPIACFDAGNPMKHHEKYLEINEAFAGRRKLMPFINRQNNEDLILALQTAGVSRGRNGFRALTAPFAHGILPLRVKLKRNGLLRFQINNFFPQKKLLIWEEKPLLLKFGFLKKAKFRVASVFRRKGGEKLAETEEDLLQHRTDGTDAFDTLYIGCAKFPQQTTTPIVVSGVS